MLRTSSSATSSSGCCCPYCMYTCTLYAASGRELLRLGIGRSSVASLKDGGAGESIVVDDDAAGDADADADIETEGVESRPEAPILPLFDEKLELTRAMSMPESNRVCECGCECG